MRTRNYEDFQGKLQKSGSFIKKLLKFLILKIWKQITIFEQCLNLWYLNVETIPLHLEFNQNSILYNYNQTPRGGSLALELSKKLKKLKNFFRKIAIFCAI